MITKYMFICEMESIRERTKARDEFLHKIDAVLPGSFEPIIEAVDSTDERISFLAAVVGDKDELIEYYIYETKWQGFKMTLANGEEIEVVSYADLWEAITKYSLYTTVIDFL